MQRWNLEQVRSTDKVNEREPGSDAPRAESGATPRPQVLFSHPECRAVLVALDAGGRMGDHSVRERATVQVVSGHVAFTCGDDEVDCPAGTLLALEPGERHSVQAHEATRLLLLLTPWRDHPHEPERLPANASAPPA